MRLSEEVKPGCRLHRVSSKFRNVANLTDISAYKSGRNTFCLGTKGSLLFLQICVCYPQPVNFFVVCFSSVSTTISGRQCQVKLISTATTINIFIAFIFMIILIIDSILVIYIHHDPKRFGLTHRRTLMITMTKMGMKPTIIAGIF